ncbi:MAG: PAS domain S-box protein, partial [Proteobacteria bacterium]|nr:PAS domain S-box protein [Pseudomonadota bacterium]
NKRGQVRWVENFSVAIDWDGEKAGLNFLTDITDRKAAEGELHWHRDQLNEMVREWGDEMAVAEQELERTLFGQLQAEQELRIRDLALKSAVNAIALGDLDGNLVYVNPSCLKLWGCQDETEVLGRPICQFWADEGRARAVFEELVQSGSWEGEMKGRRKDGTAFDGFLAASLVRDELGHPICTMGWYVDITRQKAAQEQLLMYQDQLRSLACELAMTQLRERRRIAGQLHDRIGQTLCLSKMKLERIQESARTSQAGAALNEVAEEIKNVIANLRSLITDLNPPILSELGLVSGLAWLAEGLESEHGLRVRLFDDGRPKPLSEDMRDLLFQAARELAMNSIRHGRSTSLRIDLKTADDKITIVFQDDGIGFDLDTLRPASVNNKGLGIFGIRERLAGRGGGLVVESMPGLGTRVVLTAPLTG